MKKDTKSFAKLLVVFTMINLVIFSFDVYRNRISILKDANIYELVTNFYFIGMLGIFCLLPAIVPATIKSGQRQIILKTTWIKQAAFLLIYALIYYGAINLISSPLA